MEVPAVPAVPEACMADAEEGGPVIFFSKRRCDLAAGSGGFGGGGFGGFGGGSGGGGAGRGF